MRIFLLTLSTFFILIGITFPSLAFAGTEDNISGWAWSDDIGWISFNCTNDSSCATDDYGVNENTDGTLVGYAWSSNIGWIEFGNLSGFPSGSGTQAVNAKVSGGSLIGWAKALDADGLGWDGWISLSGTNYGVTLSGANFTGYAWDSGLEGWISFNAAGSNGVHLTSSVTLDAQSPLGTSIANNTNVPYGTVANLVWTVSNLAGATCSVSETSGTTGFTTISNINTSGSASTSGLAQGAYAFAISCTSGATTVASANVSFTVGAQPAGFSLGPDDTTKITFLPAGWSQSETKTISVNAVGGFTGNVTVGISGFPTMPNASTTALYSFNGGAYSADPSPITIPYNGSFTFRIEISEPLTAAYCSGGGNPCTITLQGTSPSISSVTKNLFITPSTFNPQFQEL